MFPPGFSMERTPLITFRRVDLLLEPSTISRLHFDHEFRKGSANDEKWGGSFALFSDERVWTLGPEYYMELFVAPAPMRYGTLVVSTAGHWTTTVLAGLRDEREGVRGYGIDSVLELFGMSMTEWAERVQARLDVEAAAQASKNSWGAAKEASISRQVVVRAYLSGHEDCHEKRAPWDEVQPYDWEWYNWKWIADMNNIFEKVVSSAAYRDIHFLRIDRPGMLRPDAVRVRVFYYAARSMLIRYSLSVLN